MSEEVEQNACADSALADENDTNDVSCSTSGPSEPQAQIKQTSTPVKKIALGDSDDDGPDFSWNMGLSYSDHNYDVPDPSKRYKPNPADISRFEKIEGISLNEKNEIVFGNTRNIVHSAIMRNQAFRDSDEIRRLERISRKADFSNHYPEGHSVIPSCRSSDMGGYALHDGRRTHPTMRSVKSRTFSGGAAAEFGIPPSTKKVDQPPHRLQEFRSSSSVAPPRSGPHFNAADPSTGASLNAPAPLLVCGNRSATPRNAARIKRDDFEEQLISCPPNLKSPLSSPKKQVHFLEGAISGSPVRGEQRINCITTPLQRKVPNNKPIPPHRQLASNSNASMRNAPIRATVPGPEAHTLPENVIEDSPRKLQPKAVVDSALPPHLADIAVELSSRLPSNKLSGQPDHAEGDNAEMVIATIASITKEIEREQKMLERPIIDSQLHGASGSESTSHETYRARGRPRGNVISRNRNSLSNSSGTIGSSSPQSAYANGSPTKSFNLSYANTKQDIHSSRPPVSSPARTNLDFNNHVSSYGTIGNTHLVPARFSFQYNRKVPTNKLQQDEVVPTAKPRGRRRQSSSHYDKKYPTENVTFATDGDSAEDNWTTNCICGLDHGEGLMVSCDVCSSWQHGPCYGFQDESEFPQNWLCKDCDPKKILKHSKEEALKIQENLGFYNPQKKGRRSSTTSKEPAKKLSATPKTPKSLSYTKKYQPMGKNSFTKRARGLLEVLPDSGIQAQTIQDENARRMVVAPGMEGLVATRSIPPGEPIMEYVGNVMLPDERTRVGFQKHAILFDGLVFASMLSNVPQRDFIFIDASRQGGEGRFARRCCRPNTYIKHSLVRGQFTLYLVAKEEISKGTEITIPFDVDCSLTDMKENCWCKSTPEVDACLFRMPNSDYSLGHKEVEVETKILTDEDKKQEKRGRPKGRGRRSGQLTDSDRIPKEEKSEEELSTSTRRLSFADIESGDTIKKESDKEEGIKKEPSENSELRASRSGRRSAKELENTVVNYILPADRNKPSREEKKIAAQLALIESAATKGGRKSEPKSTEKRKSNSRNGVFNETPTKRRSRGENIEKESVVTPEVKKEESDEVESTRYQPPRKRWLEKVNTTPSPITPSAASSSTPSTSTPMGGKKQWLRRHAAQSEERAAMAAAAAANSTQISPTKKRRSVKDSISEDSGCVKPSVNEGPVSSPELRAQLQQSASEVLKKLGETMYQLPQKTEGITPSVEPEVAPKEEPVTPKKEHDDSKSKSEETPQRTSKRLSIEDYRKRRPRVKEEEVQSPRAQRGFIPSMNNLAEQSLLPIPFPDPVVPQMSSDVQPNLDDLKKTIYGEELVTKRDIPPPPPPPRKSPKADQSANVDSSRGTVASQRPSIADRLAAEFGLDIKVDRDNEVPPITQLPVCPPPVSRREQGSTHVQFNRATNRRSRW